jgi:hypothetical protein
MEKQKDKFWMCYVEKRRPPRYRHETLESAIEEAMRLARLPQNIGRKVYILNSIKVIFTETPPVPIVTKDI